MVSFVHGVVTVFNTYRAATLVGEGCAVIRKELLFQGRFQICLSPEPLGHRVARQFIGNITYNDVVFAVGVACAGIDQGSPQVVGILGSKFGEQFREAPWCYI